MRTASILAILACVAIQRSIAFTSHPRAVSHSSLTSSSTRLFGSPEPLATEGEWAAYLDEETTGVVYYFNSRTGESLWEPPTATFPEVYLKPSRRRQAEAKREEYFKSMKKDEKKDEKKESFVAKLLGGPKVEEEQPKEEIKEAALVEEETVGKEEEKAGFFSRLLAAPQPQAAESIPAPSPAPAPAPAPKKEEAPPKKGLFDSLFESLTVEPAQKTEPAFVGETESEKAARLAEEDRAKADKKAKAEEEKKMMEAVRKAEAEQIAEAARLEAEARKVVAESKKAEAAEAKRIAELQKQEAAEAKKIAAEEKKAAAAAKNAAPEEQIIVEEKQTPIKIEIGSCVLPHPSKVMWGGEDAVFTKGRTFGVFDGVSGADKMDGLPLYSKFLAREMTQLVGPGNDLTIKDMQDYLLKAAEEADAKATGASTAVVASITEDGFLRAINLGDSACIVIRGDKVVAKTKEIVHYFDCPYQLSDISPDRPRDARKLNFELLRGDVVLMASDGIFDNLDDSEIVELVSQGPAKATAIAKRVSDRSRKVSLNSQAPTPYSKQAKRNGDPDFRDGLGGKVDDISCVVARYD